MEELIHTGDEHYLRQYYAVGRLQYNNFYNHNDKVKEEPKNKNNCSKTQLL